VGADAAGDGRYRQPCLLPLGREKGPDGPPPQMAASPEAITGAD